MDLGVRGSVKGKRIVENTEHRKSEGNTGVKGLNVNGGEVGWDKEMRT